MKKIGTIILLIMNSLLLLSQTQEQYENMKKINEESRRLEIWMSDKTDTSIYIAYDSHFDNFIHKEKRMEFNGRLEDGIANLMNLPRNIIFSSDTSRIHYLRYRITIPYSMHKDKMYEAVKETMLTFLERWYSFDLLEIPDSRDRDCWLFKIKDDSKLPKSVYLDSLYINPISSVQGVVFQTLADSFQIYGNLSVIKHFVEMRSKCFAVFQIPYDLTLLIPKTIFFDFDRTRDFFDDYGIEVTKSTVPYTELYIDYR